MFRIEIFVEDKNLAPVMHALKGKALNLDIQPVENAKRQGGKVVAETSGDTLELFEKFMIEAGGMVHVAAVKKFCVKIGLKESSATYVLKKAMAAKIVKKSGKGHATNYQLTQKRTK